MSRQPQARILVADDHALVGASLKALIESVPRYVCLGVVADGITAIAQCSAFEPDLLVLDVGLPGASGLEVLAEVRRSSKGTKVLVLTGQSTVGLLQATVSAKPEGIALKTASMDELRHGIAEVLSGTSWISEDVRHLLANAADVPDLTARELQILKLLVNGMSNRDIAERLSISPKTVENHRTRTMAKLGVHSRTELLNYALKNGLIDSAFQG